MFEFQRLSGGTVRSIALATRLGNPIINEVSPEPSPQHLARYAGLLQKHSIGWEARKPATGGYNCFGHVWASRRCSIYDTDAVRRILGDDGYRRTRSPKPDDLVLFVQGRDIYHVGRIIELRHLSPDAEPIPWIVSKWNDWGGEVLHNVYDHPLVKEHGFDVQLEFWTDRPRVT